MRSQFLAMVKLCRKIDIVATKGKRANMADEAFIDLVLREISINARRLEKRACAIRAHAQAVIDERSAPAARRVKMTHIAYAAALLGALAAPSVFDWNSWVSVAHACEGWVWPQ